MKHRLLTLLAVLLTTLRISAENYILYTSKDEKVVTPSYNANFGANIVSNTYKKGQGKILFDGDVTMIGEDAFHGFYLTSIVIPNSITSIESNTFYNCYSLTSVEIPNSVISIGDYAFRYCSSLSSVKIPYSVTSIGESAFYGCSGVTEISSLSTIPPKVGNSCFYGVPTSTSVLMVPTQSIEAYKDTEGWKDFTNIVALSYATGVDADTATDALTTTFYTIDGKRVECPTSGIYIKHGINSDGTMSTKKVRLQ